MTNDCLDLTPELTPTEKITTLVAIIVPFLGLILAIAMMWGWGVGWLELGLLAGMYIATGLGVTIGFHRLFSHKSFEAFWPVKFLFGVLGSMSMQGPMLRWVAVHRRHHEHSDGEEDPHSPHGYGGGFLGVVRGLWHAHIGWMFDEKYPNLRRYVRDLHDDRMVQFISRMFGLWVAIGLAIPTLIGWAVTGTWQGAALGLLWGGLVRIFVVHHATFSINSICHVWGYQSYRGEDESRNNFLCGWLGLGEGWHNNHHAFPASARHGLAIWEFDLSYLVIRALKLVGLAWDIRLPSPQALEAKVLRVEPRPAEAKTPSPIAVPPVLPVTSVISVPRPE